MNPEEKAHGGNNPSQNQPAMDKASQHVVMGILSYLGPLVIVSFIVSKHDQFVKFHIKQGLVLFAIEIIVWILGSVLWFLWPLISLINLALFVLSIIGIVNVAQHRQKALPIVGGFSKHFNF